MLIEKSISRSFNSIENLTGIDVTVIRINWNPTNRQLRQFGVICSVALPAIGWLWGGGPKTISGLLAIGCVLAVIGCFFPRALRIPFLSLTVAATPLGLIIGELAMLLIYFGVFLPIGLCFRLLGRDALQLKMGRSQTTYWQARKPAGGPESYYRQS